MKKCFIPYSLIKTTLAVLAAAVTLFASAPARANTAWAHGGNWSSWVGLDQNVIEYPAGITNGMTWQQAGVVADAIANDYHNVGINFVRFPFNPATVSGNWAVTTNCINRLLADGMTVDLGCWYIDVTTTKQITNYTIWQNAWEQMDAVYGSNNKVYFEPINEPGGYTWVNLSNQVYNPYLNFISKSQDHIILDGIAAPLAPLYNMSRFQNCLLAYHDYVTANETYASAEKIITNILWGCETRTIVNEVGANTFSGADYQDSSSGNSNVVFLAALCDQCAQWNMGMAWFPAHQTPDLGGVLNNKTMFYGPGEGIINRSLVNELQNRWGFFTPASAALCDFNVIGTTDFSTYRPSTHSWEIQSGGGGAWGTSTDIAVPADYAGVGTAQLATWRGTNGNWYLDGVSGGGHYGTNGDIPVPGDYLGVGSAQLAVWRPSNGNWYVNGGATTQWGTNGDIPVPGYYNTNGVLDLAVYRPSTCTWWIKGGSAVQWGQAGDIPVPGNYFGDGTTQIAVFRPSTGQWIVNGGSTVSFGQSGDVPVPGDYIGAGYTQMAVWRPSDNTWQVYQVSTNTWGTTGDVPLPLPYAIRHYSLGYTN
jgi:hypothetical protein